MKSFADYVTVVAGFLAIGVFITGVQSLPQLLGNPSLGVSDALGARGFSPFFVVASFIIIQCLYFLSFTVVIAVLSKLLLKHELLVVGDRLSAWWGLLLYPVCFLLSAFITTAYFPYFLRKPPPSDTLWLGRFVIVCAITTFCTSVSLHIATRARKMPVPEKR